MAPCKINCTGNEKVIIDADGGEANITYSKFCKIFASNTKILIKHSKKVNLDVADSAFSLSNGENVTANGDHITLHGENLINCLMHGANNCATVENSNDVILSGSRSSLILIASQHPKVYGMGNVIAGQSNENLIVCGHENAVVAEQNTDLKVLGHDNQVSATRTQKVSVEGNRHKVFVKDVAVPHKIIRTFQETNMESELITDNEINFIGIPTRCPVFDNILPQHRPRIIFPIIMPSLVSNNSTNNENSSSSHDTKRNSLGPAEELRCVCEKFFEEYKQRRNASMKIPVFPQLRIRYMDKAIISNEDYEIGIFHVQITGLVQIHRSDLLVKVRVLSDELDAGTYKSLMSPSNSKSVTFAGCKNGRKQTLRLTGNYIFENADKSFSVSFFEENEIAVQAVNMEKDDSDTEIMQMKDADYSWDMDDISSSDSDAE